MNLTSLVWKELWERRTAMCTSLLAVALGVAGFVAIRSVCESSEQEVARELSALGANVLILPRDATLQDYYAADAHGETIPESHATELALANLAGVEHIAPKLSVSLPLEGRKFTLTGILPQEDYRQMSTYGGLQLASEETGCRKACARKAAPKLEDFNAQRVLSKLDKTQILVGSDVWSALDLHEGSEVDVLGEKLMVLARLAPTGTVDDARVFGHLHTVQRLAKTGEVVNAIEIMGCCEDAAGDLVPKLKAVFPDVKVVTISQVVATQVSVNRLMTRLSALFLGVLALLGGASMATALYANVAQRRREIGSLLACGATPALVARMFLFKGAILGLAGGLLGVTLGVLLGVTLGPQFAGVAVAPAPGLALMALGLAVALAAAASYFPARYASRLDPCLCFREV